MENTEYDIKSMTPSEVSELIVSLGDKKFRAKQIYQWMHQKLVALFTTALQNYIKSNGGSCEVYPAPFAVFLNQDSYNYVEPDISVICDPSKMNDKGCNGAPDFIIEIVSPSSQRMDYLTKLFKYRTAGVREYWIVNPMTRIVQVYCFGEPEDSTQYSFDEEISVGIYSDLKICIADLLK